MDIQIYSRPGCVHCINAKQLLNSKQLPYTEFIIEKDISLEDLKTQFPLASSLPIVVIDERWIGGEEQLRIYIADNQ